MSDRRPTRPRWRGDRVLIGGTVALAVAPYTPLWSTIGFYALVALAALLCAQRARAAPSEREPWSAFAAGIALWLAGDLSTQLLYGSANDAPAPSVGDAFYLLAYGALYAGLVLLVRTRMPRQTRALAIDGAIGGLALAALVVAILIPRISATATVPQAVIVINVVYSLFDVLLLGLLLTALAVVGWRACRSWILVGAGLATLVLADTAYTLLLTSGRYAEGSLFDAGYLIAFALIGLAAWQPPRPAPAAREDPLGLALPCGMAVLAIAVVAYGNFESISPVAQALGRAAVLVAAIRVALTLHERLTFRVTRMQAITDDLTGLPNRRLLYRELEAAVRSGGRLAFVLIDLDGFKELNDTLGHRAGDDVLRRVSDRLAGAVPPGGVLARLGGDEFGVVLPGTSVAHAEAAAQAMRAALEPAFDYDGLRLEIGASAGVAAFPDDGESADELIGHADMAMYAAKDSGGGVERFSPARDARSRDRLSLVGELRAAIERDELVLHFQPQADPRTGVVAGVEALVRWEHPERGLLAPAEFLPAAERTSLMRPLTLWVLDRAVAQAAAWRRAGTPLRIAVNLDVANLIDRQLPHDVASALERHGAEPDQLVLEITERVMMADPERSAEVLGGLAGLGVMLALDDFGTGQTALAHLQRLPLRELKIDRMLVADIATDAAAAAIVAATVQLAHTLGLRVVAEGAEDRATVRRLADMGCDLLQGYALSRPLPAAELLPWLRRRPALQAAA